MSYEAFGDDDDGHMECYSYSEKQVHEHEEDARDAERTRIASYMRSRYPQSRHAREWAEWIESLCVHCGCEQSGHVTVHAGSLVSVVAEMKECPGYERAT